MVHQGLVVEIKDETGARPITRYVERSQRITEITKYASQDSSGHSYAANLRNKYPSSRETVCTDSYTIEIEDTPSDQDSSFNTSNSCARTQKEYELGAAPVHRLSTRPAGLIACNK